MDSSEHDQHNTQPLKVNKNRKHIIDTITILTSTTKFIPNGHYGCHDTPTPRYDTFRDMIVMTQYAIQYTKQCPDISMNGVEISF